MDSSLHESGSDESFVAKLQEARRGSNEARGQLLESCRAYLLHAAARKLPDALKAKVDPCDLAQDAIVKGYEHFGEFLGENDSALRGWLRRILLNQIANLVRNLLETSKGALWRELSLDSALWRRAAKARLYAKDITPSSGAAANEIDELVHEALGKLSPQHRQVVLWHCWEAQPWQEIGRRLDRSATAARKLWQRAVDELRLALETVLQP